MIARNFASVASRARLETSPRNAMIPPRPIGGGRAVAKTIIEVPIAPKGRS